MPLSRRHYKSEEIKLFKASESKNKNSKKNQNKNKKASFRLSISKQLEAKH